MGWDGIKDRGVNTQFGKPGAPVPNYGGVRGGGKTFRQMIAELMFMDEDELKAYAADERNPKVVRRAAKTLTELTDIKEISCAADIIESKPVQLIDARTTLNQMSQEEFLENIEKVTNPKKK